MNVNMDYGYPATNSELPQPVQAQQQTQDKQYGFWQIEYYAKFFNVDTMDVSSTSFHIYGAICINICMTTGNEQNQASYTAFGLF